MKIKLSKAQWETIGKKAGWEDGYYKGPLKEGYPPSYFDESGKFEYPWVKNKPSSLASTDTELHRECIIALGDLVKKLSPGESLPKVDWLIKELQKKVDMADDISEQKKQLDRALGRPE